MPINTPIRRRGSARCAGSVRRYAVALPSESLRTLAGSGVLPVSQIREVRPVAAIKDSRFPADVVASATAMGIASSRLPPLDLDPLS